MLRGFEVLDRTMEAILSSALKAMFISCNNIIDYRKRCWVSLLYTRSYSINYCSFEIGHIYNADVLIKEFGPGFRFTHDCRVNTLAQLFTKQKCLHTYTCVGFEVSNNVD